MFFGFSDESLLPKTQPSRTLTSTGKDLTRGAALSSPWAMKSELQRGPAALGPQQEWLAIPTHEGHDLQGKPGARIKFLQSTVTHRKNETCMRADVLGLQPTRRKRCVDYKPTHVEMFWHKQPIILYSTTFCYIQNIYIYTHVHLWLPQSYIRFCYIL